MPAPFNRLTLAQFRLLMDRTLLRRQIDAVHVHHTWKPTRADWRGVATVEAMARFHVSQGFDDIAQHVTIDPAGGIWTGRNWNAAPASSRGHNGSSAKGPFMFEMVGDFDTGRDPFDGPQRDAAIAVTAHVLAAFGLTTAAIRFHHELNNRQKTCPGSAVSKAAFVAAVTAAMAKPRGMGRTPARGAAKAGPAAPAARLFDPRFLLGYEVTQAPATSMDMTNASVPEHDLAAAFVEHDARADVATRQRARRFSRDLSALAESGAARGDDWRELKPHVVNLTLGELSEGGEFVTTPADLDAIIDAIRDRAASTPTLKVMLHAHGGLVSEKSALGYARGMYKWWLDKDVYPIYFVWETGLLETIIQALPFRRDIFDFTTDPVLEEAARPVGRPIWNRMKKSALLSSTTDPDSGVAGGALLFARKLAAFLQTAGAANVEVHAVGHSAGAIFQAHLLPALIAAGLPKVASLSLLAPAITTALFKSHLAPLVKSKAVARHALFTMDDETERDDNVGVVYRKSLLYLVSEAFEAGRGDPILGLQRALKKDSDLRTLYGLDTNGEPLPGVAPAEIQYSRSEGAPANPLTRSRTHGGFDNDPATMSSVLRRILGVPDSTGLGVADFPADVARTVALEPTPPPAGRSAASASPSSPAIVTRASGGGRRLALCIGIDRYRDSPLLGCVNDARAWSRALGDLGFDVRQLFDEQATAAAITDAVQNLLGHAAAGDVVALQYSGHGTQIADGDGDETDGFDEALVPVDYHAGRVLLTDDVMAGALGRLPAGAALTLFMDCCHCGTNSRFAPSMRAVGSATDRVRYLPLSPEVMRAARRSARASRAARARFIESSAAGVIHLAACQDDEYAWESSGQGDFTAAAIPELAAAQRRGDTNEQFLASVRGLVVKRGRQHPMMMQVASGMAHRPLLAPLSAGAADRVTPDPAPTDLDRQLLQHLDAVAALLRQRVGR